MESQPQNPDLKKNPAGNYNPCQYVCGIFHILNVWFFGTRHNDILSTQKQQHRPAHTVLFYKLYISYQT